MKTIITFCILLFAQYGFSQNNSALTNFGAMQIHNNGAIGFHINLINNGRFNNNSGLAGFYNLNQPLSISGTSAPKFNKMEVDVPNNLNLGVSVHVVNELIFLEGNIKTPRKNPNIKLTFYDRAISLLEENIKNIDGYTSYIGNNGVKFPTGHRGNLRQIEILKRANNSEFTTAYYYENPNSPTVLLNQFRTLLINTSPDAIVTEISSIEFWDILGEGETSISLTWGANSFITDIANSIEEITVAGWNKSREQWENLGVVSVMGDLNSGTVTSEVFNAADYDLVTFAANPIDNKNGIQVFNFLSPNGDGKNETLIINGIANKQNILRVFNRSGTKVFQKTNYQNDWTGISQAHFTYNKEKRLPAGTYFYTVTLPETNTIQSGYIYITY